MMGEIEVAEPTGDINVIAKLLDWGWAILLAFGGYIWKAQNDRIDRLEVTHAKRIDETNGEVDIQRGNIAKLFDKLEEHARRSEDRHHELLTAIHTGLAQKADK
jgi:hypothetical protein